MAIGISNELMGLMKNQFGDKFKKTKLTDSLQGQMIIIAGGNSLGKTKQCANFPNPIFLCVEDGTNGLSNAGALPVNSWNDITSYMRKFKKKEFKELLDQGTEITLIIDGAEGLGMLAQDYVCSNAGKTKISEIPHGAGWKDYEVEVERFASGLKGMGYTVVLIFHEVEDKNGKRVMKGDWRTTDPFRNKADITVHLESNGVDDEGNVIPSSAYMYETPEFFGRTRFEYMDTYLEEFTAENLIKAYREGIRKQAEAEGAELVTFKEQHKTYETEVEDFETVKKEIQELMEQIPEESPEEDELFDKIEELFGDGFQLRDVTKRHLQGLVELRNWLKEDLLDR